MSEPQRPGAVPPEAPSQKRGIWALCLTLFGGCCCYIPTIVGTVMAFKVLNKSEWEGVNHGRELAIGALGVAAFQVGGLTLSLIWVFGSDTWNLSSGRYGAEPANADATIVAISDLHVRDCFDDPSLHNRRGPLRQAPCDGPHDAEVADLIPIEAEQFPGPVQVHELARECRSSFNEYVGEPIRESTLAMTYYYPTKAGWTDTDSRQITCVVWDVRGPLKEFVADADRG